jgi:hypothetical protein
MTTKQEKLIEKQYVFNIRNVVKNLDKDEFVDLQTRLSSRRLAPRLFGIEDDEGHCMIYRCQGIPGGVRVICTSKFKITNVRAIEASEICR